MKKTIAAAITAISAAVSDGNISQGQAATMKMQMGIGQADFTRSKTTKAKRKAKRKMQKESRRINRGTTKGQTNRGGRKK